ncbi:MAG: hypothetical protein EXX96DRAFT_478752 [Benjaminiella poitrasii]|nr:MAG: hypothetical protein EXX96DRAFT_478752 [Benjaminiella poitrasii]
MTATFKGMAILCFYPQHCLFQGHCINTINNESPYSLAGKLLPDYIDPNHNECMEPDDFYQVVIEPYTNDTERISLILRRTKNNDASNLWAHENENDTNEGYVFMFETDRFISGQQALLAKNKYFANSPISTDDKDIFICFGKMKFAPQDQ